MAGVQAGQQKWEEKMQTADQKYQSMKGEMASNYQSGCSAAGITVGPRTMSAYQSGISRASLANVQGKGAKWAANYLRGMAR